MSAYHQRSDPADVPVVTFVQVKSEPFTPRALARRPAFTHWSPTLATFAALSAAFACGETVTTMATATDAITAPAIFFLNIETLLIRCCPRGMGVAQIIARTPYI